MKIPIKNLSSLIMTGLSELNSFYNRKLPRDTHMSSYTYGLRLVALGGGRTTLSLLWWVLVSGEVTGLPVCAPSAGTKIYTHVTVSYRY